MNNQNKTDEVNRKMNITNEQIEEKIKISKRKLIATKQHIKKSDDEKIDNIEFNELLFHIQKQDNEIEYLNSVIMDLSHRLGKLELLIQNNK